MRKEVVFAILAGISIGLIAAFGTWKVSKLVKVSPSPVTKNERKVAKVIENLTIDGLKNYDVLTENPIIKGLTSPNTDILISTNDDDYYAKSNAEGEFAVQIELPSGISEVNINETKLILVYSPEAENGKTAYVGTLTDITSETIQLRTDKGEILQVSVNSETDYINNLKKNIAVKITDLAIGDYIVAIGNITSNKVLATERILITSPIVSKKIEYQKITIETLSKTKINDITLPKKWNGPNIKELEIGNEIIIVGTKNDDKFELRSIFLKINE